MFKSFWYRALRRGLVLESPIWSWLMVIGALSRAGSYWIRPPETNTPAASRIEGALSYPSWTIALIMYSAAIAIGVLSRRDTIAWLGHLAGLGASATLALSILFAALLDGAGWSAFWPLVVVGAVHIGRLNALGPRVTPSVKRRDKVT